MKLIPIFLGLFLTASIGFSQSIPTDNHFTDATDTLFIKSIRVKGAGLFRLGVSPTTFKDTTEWRKKIEDFTFPVIYPDNLSDVKIAFECIYLEPFQYYSAKGPAIRQIVNGSHDQLIGILSGTLNQQKVFLLDQNHNWDFRDDTVRVFKKLDFHSSEEIFVCKYLINKGNKTTRDSLWLKIGFSDEDIWSGTFQYQLSSFSIGQEPFQIAVAGPHSAGASYSLPIMAVLSENGIARDTLLDKDILNQGEFMHLGRNYYKFDGIYNGCGTIILTKINNYEEQVGTQVGLIAPDYTFRTIGGDTVNASTLKNKLVLMANISGCTPDSYKVYKDMVAATGDRLIIVGIESGIKKELGGKIVDVTDSFNKSFYKIFRNAYSSYDCYLIGTNGRIADKFSLFDWKDYLNKYQ